MPVNAMKWETLLLLKGRELVEASRGPLDPYEHASVYAALDRTLAVIDGLLAEAGVAPQPVCDRDHELTAMEFGGNDGTVDVWSCRECGSVECW